MLDGPKRRFGTAATRSRSHERFDREMRMNPRYPGESESDSSGVGTPVSSPYDPFTNYLSPRPKFLRYDPGRHCEVLRRLEEVMDDFGGTSIGSNSGGSVSEDSAEQEQEDSEFDGAGNQVEMPQICRLRWLCKLLLLLHVLVLLMVCICHTRISFPLQDFEDWQRRSSCTYEDVSEELVEFVEIDVSSKSISSPSDEIGDVEGRHGNLSSTNEEGPEKIVELHESSVAQTGVDSLGDIGDAAEWMEMDEVMKGSYQYDELDEAVEGRDGGIWQRAEVELEESSKAAETRLEKNDDVCEQENEGIESNFYWIKKSSEPQGSGIAKLEVGSETENLLLEETHEVGEVTSGFIGIELVTMALLCVFAAAVLAFVLVLYLRRKKKFAYDSPSTSGRSFRVSPIKCTREFAENSERGDRLASDRVSSSPLESSPSLGRFTTTEMISTRKEDGTGEAWVSIATPVRRSSRIHDRAIRSRRHLMSSS
ncbi:hypothetical protein ACJRO7_005726 [Eucalyptus globulus]|uniref:Transmembrane protein n=1 Tax=Eucalyptus globulus TaxID=34317 RepID=A0ABD3J0S9_EUCGL